MYDSSLTRACGRMTPLPAARPDALITIDGGWCVSARTWASAAAWSVKVANAAVGMPWRCMKALEKALDA